MLSDVYDASGRGCSCRWYVVDSSSVCVCVYLVLVFLVLLAPFVLVGGVCVLSLCKQNVCVLQSATAAAFK